MSRDMCEYCNGIVETDVTPVIPGVKTPSLYRRMSSYYVVCQRQKCRTAHQAIVDQFQSDEQLAIEGKRAAPSENKQKFLDRLNVVWADPSLVTADDTTGNGTRLSLALPQHKRYRAATFATLKFTQENQANGMGKAIKDFLPGRLRSMLFAGPKGRGKTWASYALINGFLVYHYGRAWHSAERITWRELTSASRDCTAFNVEIRRSGEERISRWKKMGLLVIDELGLSKPPEGTFDIIHDLIDSRYGDELWTLATTTRSVEELDEYVGGGIADRLIGPANGGRLIMFTGENLRQGAEE